MNTYKYQGYTFKPVRALTAYESAQSLKQMSDHLRSDTARHDVFTRYDGGTYDYKAFYDAMRNDPADIFHCEETGLDYIPGENELFVWED